MTRRSLLAVPLIATLVPIVGCGGSPQEDESALGTSLSALLNDNALNANALNANALYPNALNANALNANALDANALASDALAAIQDPGPAGDLSRQLLKYTVSCALDSTQSFAFSWSDGQGKHDVSYPGLLGLATGWAAQPLDLAGQRWVSACLISRVNYFGTPVMLSARGPTAGLKHNPQSELDTYVNDEGAFWGNLFLASPYAFSCNYAPDVAYSRLSLRDCAAGYLDAVGVVHPCGIIQILGSCDATCSKLQPAFQYYPSCLDADGSQTSSVVTIFLH